MRNHEQEMKLAEMNQLLAKKKLQEQDVIGFFAKHSDIIFQPAEKNQDVIHFYCEGMIDTVQYNEYFHKILSFIKKGARKGEINEIPPIENIQNMEEMIKKVFSGYVIFYKNRESHFYAVDFSKIPSRKPEESKTEISLKGPRDGFTEELKMNIALIRKRLKTESLYSETYEIGQLSKTKVALMYISNKIKPHILQEIQKRLKTLETECIVSSGQLEQWLADRTFSLFPLFDYITRPDFVVQSLLRGRFALIVDGSPSILIGPINLLALLKSPEDIHFPYFFVMFQRLIRLLGLAIAIFIPGLYVAITNVNLDQLPFLLLATVVVSRQGLPMPLPLEAFFILFLFEILREAGIRMPSAVGQTVSIVGGLIIGDAAIRAGIVSPTLLVVISGSIVATYTLVNQSLTGTVTILRIYTMLISIFLGVYGFILSFISIIVYLSQLESFRIAYLEPISSLNVKEFLSAFLSNPFKRKNFNSIILTKRKDRS